MNLDRLTAYELVKQEELKDIKGFGTVLTHVKSGARIALIETEDENKTFSIAFRTPPTDSTGVAHILEHSVLCGSKNFPVKDPFVELVKGSLNTFLNAMTYPDKTVYPVASCNDKDFQNLMHIYLDAVFYPNIYKQEKIFRQEGWSYELNAPEEELCYNGVVYNEMKGAFSSPDGILEREIMNSLFPDTSYGVESGGDPEVIPELTYEAFLDFHRRYYHPSNSYIFLYGDMDMEEKLRFIDENYLSAFDRIQVDSHIEEQKAFEAMRDITLSYPISEEEPLEENTYLAYQKVIGNTGDIRKMLAFDILDYAVLSAPGSPIEKALLEAGIGKDISGYFESDVMQPYFSITSKNAKAEDKKRFREVIENTIRELVDKGISRKALLAGINHEEFAMREADFGRFPKGIMYGLSVLSTWLYDDEAVFDTLKILGDYAWLKEQVDTGYFEELLSQAFLTNEFGSVVTLKPEKGLAAAKDKALAEKLAKLKASFSREEIDELVANTRALREYQSEKDTEEDLRKIPMLERSDIKREPRPFECAEYEVDKVKLLHQDYETTGIAYDQILFKIPELPLSLLPYLGILLGTLGMVDTKEHTYDELVHEVNLRTGGIGITMETYPVYEAGKVARYDSYVKIKGKTFYDNTEDFFDLASEIAFDSILNSPERIREILSQGISRLQMKFMSAGHTSAVLRGSAYDGGASLIKEYTQGIAFYRVVSDIERNYEERQNELVNALNYLMSVIFTPDNLMFSYTGAAEELERQKAGISSFVEKLRGFRVDIDGVEVLKACEEELVRTGTDKIKSLNEGFTSASKVQYVARTGRISSYHGALNILKTILNYGYLWENLRVKGGAYGCMSGFSKEGSAYMVSYRDPHLKGTNEVYESVPGYLRSFTADEREMTKYVIGTVSGMDTPLPPEQLGARALLAKLTGITYEEVAKERAQVLDAQPEDIRALADIVEELLSKGHLCVIGGEEKIRNAADMFDSIESLL